MTELIRYEAMRRELATCAHVDEAKDIQDKAAALQAYARQRDDRELEVWTAEIRLRATIRIGELSRELDTSKGGSNPEATLPAGGKSKGEALEAAGISTSAAHRAEELVNLRDHGEAAAIAAIERHFAACEDDQQPATLASLTEAIRAAVEATMGPVPEKKPRQARLPTVDPRHIDFSGPLHTLADIDDFDAEYLAGEVQPALLGWEMEAADIVRVRLTEYIHAMQRRGVFHAA